MKLFFKIIANVLSLFFVVTFIGFSFDMVFGYLSFEDWWDNFLGLRIYINLCVALFFVIYIQFRKTIKA